MLIWIVLGAIAVLILLSGISFLIFKMQKPPLTAGFVVGKEKERERRWIQLVPYGTGRMSQSPLMYIPFLKYDDEDWVFILEEEGGDVRHRRRGRLYVSQDTWNRIQIGDFYKARDLDYTKDRVASSRATEEEIRKYS